MRELRHRLSRHCVLPAIRFAHLLEIAAATRENRWLRTRPFFAASLLFTHEIPVLRTLRRDDRVGAVIVLGPGGDRGSCRITQEIRAAGGDQALRNRHLGWHCGDKTSTRGGLSRGLIFQTNRQRREADVAKGSQLCAGAPASAGRNES